MPIRLFHAKRLAEELGQGKVGARDRGYYLAASFLIFILFYYSGLAYANPIWSWLSVYEAVVLVAVTVFGFSKAYDAAGGDTNSQFVAEFTCLYVPVSVTTVPLVWGTFWAITLGFREAITALSESHLQIAINLSRIGANFFGLLAFLAVVFVQVITFYRIVKLFSIVRGRQNMLVNPSISTDAAR